MLYFLLVLSCLTSWAGPQPEVDEAKKSIRALIQPLIQGKNKKIPTELKGFRLDACEKHKINWLDVLFMRKDASLDYKFKEGCDIEGSISPKVFVPFPVKLKLKNLSLYKLIESQNKINANLDSKPVLFLEMRSGTLTGPKGQVHFEADYKVQINPLSKDKPIEKNLGGEIRVNEIYGKKVSIKEKILVE